MGDIHINTYMHKEMYRYVSPTHPQTRIILNQQKAVPVEEFGAALLRGMGWKGPSEEDVKVYQAQPRPQGWVGGLVYVYNMYIVCVWL